MNTNQNNEKKPFVAPSCEILHFATEDVITTSGAFEGDWDEFFEGKDDEQDAPSAQE